MTVETNNDVNASALDLVPEQFKGKENYEAWVSLFAEPSQELENVAADMRDQFTLANARNAMLALLGALVGRAAVYANDDRYRAAIYVQIAINTSKGTAPEIISICKAHTGAEIVYYARRPPCVARVFAYKLTSWNDLALLHKAVIGGERLVLTGTTEDTPFCFGLDVDASEVTHGTLIRYGTGETSNLGGGWAELGFTDEFPDGYFAELYTS